MQTYLFYDIESTGLSKSFDQVLHFAAIRTDLQLNEIERYDIQVKLNSDCIPSPRATITHHIGVHPPANSMTEYDAIRDIHALLNQPGTISLGYNTLGFDDEFLRFSFYRNLLPPYSHQFQNQCGRMDLYPIVVMYYLYKNDCLNWPMIDGKPSLKLENINAANQFVQGRSHHAMVDVEVTLALAKKLFAARDMWDYVIGYFSKNIDQQRAQQLPPIAARTDAGGVEGLMLYGKFGATDCYQAPVLALGTSLPYKNQSLWLRLDTADLSQTTLDTIPTSTWVIRKKWGEPGFILPPKERFTGHISAERQAQIQANKMWLTDRPDLLHEISHYYRHYTYPVVNNIDPESSLYVSRFWSEEENAFCRRFHAATPADKVSMTDSIQHPLIKALAIRLLGRNHPEHLSPKQQEDWQQHQQRVATPDVTLPIIDFKGEQRLTPKMALLDIDTLRKENTLDPAQHQLLEELENYLQQRFC